MLIRETYRIIHFAIIREKERIIFYRTCSFFFLFVYLSLSLGRALVAIVATLGIKGKKGKLLRGAINGRNYDFRRPPSGIKGGQARATEKRYRLIAGTDCLLRNVCMPISRDLWRVSVACKREAHRDESDNSR